MSRRVRRRHVWEGCSFQALFTIFITFDSFKLKVLIICNNNSVWCTFLSNYKKINVWWPSRGHRICIYKLGVGQFFSGHKLAVKYFQRESRPSPTLAALSVKNQDLERLSGSELFHGACVGASAATGPGSCPRCLRKNADLLQASNLWPCWISAI